MGNAFAAWGADDCARAFDAVFIEICALLHLFGPKATCEMPERMKRKERGSKAQFQLHLGWLRIERARLK